MDGERGGQRGERGVSGADGVDRSSQLDSRNVVQLASHREHQAVFAAREENRALLPLSQDRGKLPRILGRCRVKVGPDEARSFAQVELQRGMRKFPGVVA